MSATADQEIVNDNPDIITTPEFLQRKLYFLADELKKMHAQLPESYQVRISYDLLTELANCLLNDTIFEIVKGMMELQHVTELHLLELRQKALDEYANEVQDWKNKISDPEELAHLLALMKIKHKKRMRDTDKLNIVALDQKLTEQQSTMQQAGVPGFFVTNDNKEITIQMFLFDFILRLSRIKDKPNM